MNDEPAGDRRLRGDRRFEFEYDRTRGLRISRVQGGRDRRQVRDPQIPRPDARINDHSN